MIVSSYGAASSDFTKVMREAGYIYPFDWRRRRMDRDYEEPQGIRISVDYNKLDIFLERQCNLFCKKFNKKCIKEKNEI